MLAPQANAKASVQDANTVLWHTGSNPGQLYLCDSLTSMPSILTFSVSVHQTGMIIPHGGRSSRLGQGETDVERGGEHQMMIGSLPLHLSPHLLGGFLCPVCSTFVASDVMEIHLIMCLTKSRLRYNEDVLVKDSGECAICLDEMEQGHTISRLPCLCIYHKGCIDEWFEVNRSCPEHPLD
uniref:E3 ubiquitin-protein ligase ZNRF1 n=1 Tax=Oncorhynchus kisutch TaxID=8019 RepID=A0A8C7DQM8_ONCKI